mmetsp:Transcript_21901/g.55698  ORF Transcript_21901/g.55698 Transcript_21901/m.55698 type:complete len:216 (+) Transcript_21901:901-1548(+)
MPSKAFCRSVWRCVVGSSLKSGAGMSCATAAFGELYQVPPAFCGEGVPEYISDSGATLVFGASTTNRGFVKLKPEAKPATVAAIPGPPSSGRANSVRGAQLPGSGAVGYKRAAKEVTTSESGRPPNFKKSSVTQTWKKPRKQGVRMPTKASSKLGLHETTESKACAIAVRSGPNSDKNHASTEHEMNTTESHKPTCLPYFPAAKLPSKSLYSPVV